jgi:hypothetical protein
LALCWVKAGECGQETSIEARKVSPTKMIFEITTTCEHVQALAEELGEVDVGSEMSRPLNETRVYTLATKHICRNSCIVPAAILRACLKIRTSRSPRSLQGSFARQIVCKSSGSAIEKLSSRPRRSNHKHFSDTLSKLYHALEERLSSARYGLLHLLPEIVLPAPGAEGEVFVGNSSVFQLLTDVL